METATKTLLCGDLFTQGGSGHPPVVESNILEPSKAFRHELDYFARKRHARNARAAGRPTADDARLHARQRLARRRRRPFGGARRQRRTGLGPVPRCADLLRLTAAGRCTEPGGAIVPHVLGVAVARITQATACSASPTTRSSPASSATSAPSASTTAPPRCIAGRSPAACCAPIEGLDHAKAWAPQRRGRQPALGAVADRPSQGG